MDRLLELLDDSGFLAADPSASRILAFTPPIALPDSSSRLDWNVGSHGRDHGPLARHNAV